MTRWRFLLSTSALALIFLSIRQYSKTLQSLLGSKSDVAPFTGNVTGTKSAHQAVMVRANFTSEVRAPATRYLHLYMSFYAGLNNQLQCLDLAVVLSQAYKRTLVLEAAGYVPTYWHDGNDTSTTAVILLDDLLDMPTLMNLTSTGIRISNMSTFTNEKPWKRRKRDMFNLQNIESPQELIPYDPEETGSLPENDPFPDCNNLQLKCAFGYSLQVTPVSKFPQRISLPFNRSFRQVAKQVLDSMNTTKRILGLQIRLGDRKTYPLLDCATEHQWTNGFYPHSAVVPKRKVAYCANTTSEAELSWPALLSRLLQQCENSKIATQVCNGDYGAIFVATNDVAWVKQQFDSNHNDDFNNSSTLPVYFLEDFTHVITKSTASYSSKSGSLLIEMMVLALCDEIIPSFPSSITERLLILRDQLRTWTSQDTRLNETFWAYVLDSGMKDI